MKRLTMDQLEKDLLDISGGIILDVATGRGEFINLLINSLGNYQEIIGIDSQERSLKATADNFVGKKVEFRKMDAYDLKFPSNSFDTVCISNSLHHFSDILKVLQNMKAVLKTGGYFLINEMHCDETQSEAQKSHVLLHHWWARVDSRLGIEHHRTYSSKELTQILESLNLSDQKIYEYAYPVNDPKDEAMIQKYISYFDPYVDRLIEHEAYQELKAEGEGLKERLREIGFAPASSLFIIGRKQV